MLKSASGAHDVDQVVRDRLASRRERLRRRNVHLAVDLHGIEGHDLRPAEPRGIEGEGPFPAGRRGRDDERGRGQCHRPAPRLQSTAWDAGAGWGPPAVCPWTRSASPSSTLPDSGTQLASSSPASARGRILQSKSRLSSSLKLGCMTRNCFRSGLSSRSTFRVSAARSVDHLEGLIEEHELRLARPRRHERLGHREPERQTQGLARPAAQLVESNPPALLHPFSSFVLHELSGGRARP